MTQQNTGGGAGVRTGPASSKTLKYARVINSPDELERVEAGDKLVTTNHEVIRKWAEERGAVPATVAGTEHPETGTLGALRFDFPPLGDDDRIRHVSWDEWFETFDRRRLNFIFQETTKDGRQSNFFRLENPERESA
ncbi:hypothetical protein HC028_15455 [Planosporangium flavigriseum]|uniref:Uncharacterized protein n=1 Tax=Planosporangium flavigriseum TaxID=373681 RepID=A0A8J3LXH4_9ACTN|nr:hypothetical protein [Planosporangium flavigriseum]NJC65887.1 hypothetical protein [Planosporangium flavigriseum]GIG75594.1 hypothetical protein Pfl04_39980 [Planosporangium flavigriseum]